MKKFILLFFTLPILANATGMAVSLDNLYIQNNTSKPTTVTIKNLDDKANQFSLAAKSSCKINQSIMFQPFEEQNNNFVIMVENSDKQDSIVIDKSGKLALAHDSLLKLPYTGDVKRYSLLGFCGNRLSQYKFLNVKPHTNDKSAPNFILGSCSQQSNYVYFINDSSIKLKNQFKKVNFNNIKNCEIDKS